MNQRIHFDLDQASITQESRNAPADVQIHSFGFGVVIQNLSQLIPRGQRRIADMGYPVRLVQGNDTSGPHQCGHFGNHLLRLGNVYQNQAGRGKIEGFSWQACLRSVPLANLHVVYSSL